MPPWLSRSSSSQSGTTTPNTTSSSSSSTSSSEEEEKFDSERGGRGGIDEEEEAVGGNNEETNDTTRSVDNDKRYIVREIMIRQLKEQAAYLAVGTLALAVSSLSNQALPKLVGAFMDSNNSTRNMNSSRGFLYVVVIGGSTASFLRTWVLRAAQSNVASNLRTKAVEVVLTRRHLEWFQQEQEPHRDGTNNMNNNNNLSLASPSKISAVLDKDVDQISSALTTTLANFLRGCSAVTLSAYHMIRIDPMLFVASATMVPLVGAMAVLGHSTIRKLQQRQRQLQDDQSEFVIERLQNISLVKLCQRSEDEVAAYRNQQRHLQQVEQALAWRNGVFMGGMFASGSLGLLAIVKMGTARMVMVTTTGRQVQPHDHRLTSGKLTSFATYSFLLGIGTSGILKALAEGRAARDAATRYAKLLLPDPTGTLHRSSCSAKSNTSTNGSDAQVQEHDNASEVFWIALESVSFQYQANSSTGDEGPRSCIVLKDVSLVLERGSVTACVGANGSGKSTLVHVLAGLLVPTSGNVVLSTGQRLMAADSSPSSTARRLIQVVPQSHSSGLLDISILDNVRYARPTATRDEAIQALREAGCNDEFFQSLPEGLDTRVGSRNRGGGSKLSGGQAQRVALARALLADPAFLVLDEPDSHMDAAGELAVTEAIVASARAKNRAVLMVTHSAKALEIADRVVVMEDGSIVETGTLSELRRPGSHLVRVLPDLLLP